MHTKHSLRTWALAALAMLAAAGGAAAQESGWLVGGGWGEADYGATVGDFDDGSIVSGRIDNNELGWKLFAGYRFNRHLAIELGYVDLINDFDAQTFEGLSDGTGSGFVSFPDGQVSVGLRPTGYFGEAVGHLPIGHGLSLFGKVGLLHWDGVRRTTDLNGEVDRREDGTNAVYGAGLEYRTKLGLALRAEYEVFTGVLEHDVNLITAGLSYTFR